MFDVQISCINKVNRYNPHERILNVGGYQGGQRWKVSQNEAIRRIETRENRFWVSVGGKSVWVVVATHNGNKYIKTENDSASENNLLSLPECP